MSSNAKLISNTYDIHLKWRRETFYCIFRWFPNLDSWFLLIRLNVTETQFFYLKMFSFKMYFYEIREMDIPLQNQRKKTF